ncbi:FecR family protein [Pedobacter gandavensis]|uniref:FecR family protein n=1 Tax=Pedobacter gandavensis TaxID=2679963 RepID=UPI00292DEBF0|nr:FecR domain-containing protein [Pedobacter gandavensis]
MDNEHFNKLIEHYIHQTATAEEQQELSDWYDRENNRDIIWPSISEDEEKIVDQRIFSNIVFHTQPKRNGFKRIWQPFTIAASIVICVGIAFYFYQNNQGISTEITTQNDIAPGGNKAFLTLSDGKRITLTDAKNGELAEQSGVKISKTAEGQLIYTVSSLPNEKNPVNVYNTIETPRGGTYHVRLPDGTKVWLNAASTLRFPSSFAGAVNRKVELLSGEAYFEVAKDKKHPFIVNTDQQEIMVLGTHFNINSYRDEQLAKTTLLEGSVSISLLDKKGKRKTSLIIKPNEQAVFDGENLKIINGDTEQVLAWKNGLFQFENADVKTVLRNFARWYDIDIVYQGKVKPFNFTGEIYRNLNLSEALDGLRFTGLNFKIVGRRIVVTDDK